MRRTSLLIALLAAFGATGSVQAGEVKGKSTGVGFCWCKLDTPVPTGTDCQQWCCDRGFRQMGCKDTKASTTNKTKGAGTSAGAGGGGTDPALAAVQGAIQALGQGLIQHLQDKEQKKKQAEAAAAAERERQAQQAELERQQRVRQEQERRQQEFDRDKQAAYGEMLGPKPGELGLMDPFANTSASIAAGKARVEQMLGRTGAADFDGAAAGGAPGEPGDTGVGCDQDRCLAACPTLTDAMGGRRLDAACVQRCLTMPCGPPLSPAGSTVAVPGTELRESEYFYDLQLRRTGSGAGATAAPESAPPQPLSGAPRSMPGGEVPSPVWASPDQRQIFVGGTTSIMGMNVPRNRPELRPQAIRDLGRQLDAAGFTAEQKQAFMQTSQYEFMIGVASDHSAWRDLFWRVALDELTAGRHSADSQDLYASLRGRRGDRLDCHSNGAMVCLAALSRGDVQAPHVRLLGPQVTPDSLAEWQRLIETGKVRSVEMYLVRGDPVVHVSYIVGDVVRYLKTWGIGGAPPVPPLSYAMVEAEFARRAPGVRLQLLQGCPEAGRLGFDFSFACHAMARYQSLVDAPGLRRR